MTSRKWVSYFLGSGPNRGRSPVEWGDFPFVRPFVRLFVRSSPPLGHPARPEAQPARPEAQPAWSEAQPARYEAQPASQPSLRLQAWLDGPEVGTDGQMDERMENLPILQDFVPYRGCWPACPHENQGESRAGQGNR